MCVVVRLEKMLCSWGLLSENIGPSADRHLSFVKRVKYGLGEAL